MENDQEKSTVSGPTCTGLLSVALAKCWIAIPILFVVLFFGKIAINGIEYTKYKNEFKIKCENKGGLMFVPSGVKGWPKPECRSPK